MYQLIVFLPLLGSLIAGLFGSNLFRMMGSEATAFAHDAAPGAVHHEEHHEHHAASDDRLSEKGDARARRPWDGCHIAHGRMRDDAAQNELRE